MMRMISRLRVDQNRIGVRGQIRIGGYKSFPEIRKELWGSQFWSDGGYIGTVGEGITAEIIRNYISQQGTSEEKEGYKQMNLQDFN
jgi:REP element-mobilizing transposase RayT